MLVIFPMHDKVVNTDAIDYVTLIGRTDYQAEKHVIIKFRGGAFMEFPPEVSLHEVFTTLTERSPDG